MSEQRESVLQADIYLDPDLVSNVQARLSRIEGQVRGIKRMLDNKEECERILVQMAAIRSALNQATIKLLEGHMDRCVTECVQLGEVEALDRLKNAMSLVLRKA